MARIRFSSFEFDPDAGELTRARRPVPLQEQPARVLAYLIERPGRTVARDELIHHLWGDGRHVQFAQGLNYCIRQIRIALDDQVAAPKYLATVGRRGYRWVGPPAARSGSWIRSTITRPVPAWSAAASAVAALFVATLLTGPPPTAKAPLPLAGDVRSAIRTLHVLSHQLIDPGLQTIWRTFIERS